jgi:platelet-activating factor acetylhydrolase IB subunit alpha
MLSYLHASGMHSAFEALKQETGHDGFEVDDPKAKWVGLLEKKWTSVIRLQKKVSSSLHFQATFHRTPR